MRCPNCFFTIQSGEFFENKDISFEEVVEIVDYYADNGISQIIPNAEGEALLHPRYQEIVRFIIKRLSVKPWLVTNGINLAEHADFVVQNLSEVLVSVDSRSAEGYAAYRGKGTERLFLAALSGLAKVVALKRQRLSPMAVMINCVVTADRCQEIPAMIELAEGLGVDGIRFSNFHPTGGESYSLPLYADNPAVLEVLQGVLRRRNYKIDIFLPNLLGLARPPFFCRMLSSIVIGVNGDFSPCCRITPDRQWGNHFTDADKHNNETLRNFRLGFLQAQAVENLPAACRQCGYLSQLRPVFVSKIQQWVRSEAF